MVGCLWAAKQYPAAIRIEQLWGRLRAETPFNLYCGYPIDIFGDEIEHGTVDALFLAAYTHLLADGARERGARSRIGRAGGIPSSGFRSTNSSVRSKSRAGAIRTRTYRSANRRSSGCAARIPTRPTRCSKRRAPTRVVGLKLAQRGLHG